MCFSGIRRSNKLLHLTAPGVLKRYREFFAAPRREKLGHSSFRRRVSAGPDSTLLWSMADDNENVECPRSVALVF